MGHFKEKKKRQKQFALSNTYESRESLIAHHTLFNYYSKILKISLEFKYWNSDNYAKYKEQNFRIMKSWLTIVITWTEHTSNYSRSLSEILKFRFILSHKPNTNNLFQRFAEILKFKLTSVITYTKYTNNLFKEFVRIYLGYHIHKTHPKTCVLGVLYRYWNPYSSL